MVKGFEISGPLPARASAAALRQQLVEHFVRIRPSVGERFLSDHELTRVAGLSRPTVRRALDDLERDGWIERRPGIGTFIGPRAAMPAYPARETPTVKSVRLALVVHMLGDFAHDWYAAGVIAGIDSAAEECALSLELLGARDGDVQAVSRRLLQSRPDVLALAAPPLQHTTLIGEALRLGIPSIGTGTLLSGLGIPTVSEDGADAARRAVAHLVAHGHRRIAFVNGPFPTPWVFQRHRGYRQGLIDAGLEPDEGMVVWIDADDEDARGALLRRHLDRTRPTAVLFASSVWVRFLAPLVREGLVVPRDLSVITFDQSPAVPLWLGQVQPTTIALPLLEMGRRLAHMACQCALQKPLESVTMLPCSLIEGESVATHFENAKTAPANEV